VIQAIGNRGELCFRVFEGRFTGPVFLDFLGLLPFSWVRVPGWGAGFGLIMRFGVSRAGGV